MKKITTIYVPCKKGIQSIDVPLYAIILGCRLKDLGFCKCAIEVTLLGHADVKSSREFVVLKMGEKTKLEGLIYIGEAKEKDVRHFLFEVAK
ncbi:hypothetical protein [Acinetobacter sp.]|uniref:hypothetical protein n=1 Tax=Acinetobacter sp. TaxID=472 RepID=UPI003890237E